jgi:hypothetical protein
MFSEKLKKKRIYSRYKFFDFDKELFEEKDFAKMSIEGDYSKADSHLEI